MTLSIRYHSCSHVTHGLSLQVSISVHQTGSQLHHMQGLDAGATGAYMCGPEPFMAAIGTALQELGFPGNHIYSESFSF